MAAYPLGQPFNHPDRLFKPVAGNRPAEEVALGNITASLPQKLQLLRRFNALGDNAHPELLGHADDRLGQDGGVGVTGQLSHERTVNLEAAQRKPLQVAERREAGAEVVNAEDDASLAKVTHVRRRLSALADQDALGDLELDLINANSTVR